MSDKPGAHNVLTPRAAGGVTHLIVINVGDVDAHHARAAGAGATVLVPPSDRPWGRGYEMSGTEGYIFSFISSLASGDGRRSRLGPPDPKDVVGKPYGEDSRWRGFRQELP